MTKFNDMFSGIVEEAATITGVVGQEGNITLRVKCSFADELRIDQSVAHNGVCLTVVGLNSDGSYEVTAIKETLERSNLGDLKPGDKVNKGDLLLVYEAMKMENDVTAEKDATVKRVFVKPDEVVSTDAVLIEFE